MSAATSGADFYAGATVPAYRFAHAGYEACFKDWAEAGGKVEK